jgi:hypothetical protein
MIPGNRSIRSAVILSLLALLSLVLCPPAVASDTIPGDSPLRVQTGVFVMSIHDLSLVDNSFHAVFWFWAVFPEDSPIPYRPERTVGIMQAKSFDRLFSFDNIVDSKRWVTVKFDAVIIHNWEMTDFPFDKQMLRIELEEAELDAKSIVFIPDRISSGIDSAVDIPGWEVEGFSIESRLVIDETTYGDPTLTEKSTYPQTIVTITLKREGLRLLFNLMTAAYIAFILGIMTLFLHPQYVGARKVVLTSAIITIIGNHYIIGATLPEMPAFTLIDRVMVTTFIAIAVCAILSTITSHYINIKKEKTAARINNIARWSILAIYIALNVFFYVRAIT